MTSYELTEAKRPQGYPIEANAQVSLTLNEFFQSFQIPVPASGYSAYRSYTAEPFLDTPDLLERFEILRERLTRLAGRIEQHRASSTAFERQLVANLKRVQTDLELNLKTFQVVEENPAASERRTFLQGEANRIEAERHRLRLEALDRLIELERQRDELLPEYVQLRRVAKALA